MEVDYSDSKAISEYLEHLLSEKSITGKTSSVGYSRKVLTGRIIPLLIKDEL